MSKKHKPPQENSFVEGVLKPLGIAALIGGATGVFFWGYYTFDLVVSLTVLLFWALYLGLGGISLYVFFRLIKGMREGKSYTVFNVDTPMKRFFEYLFITIVTLGPGLFLVSLVIKEVIEVVRWL